MWAIQVCAAAKGVSRVFWTVLVRNVSILALFVSNRVWFLDLNPKLVILLEDAIIPNTSI